MAHLSKTDREFIHTSLSETHSYVRAYSEFETHKRVFVWKTPDRLHGYTKHERRILSLASKYIADIKSNDERVKAMSTAR